MAGLVPAIHVFLGRVDKFGMLANGFFREQGTDRNVQDWWKAARGDIMLL